MEDLGGPRLGIKVGLLDGEKTQKEYIVSTCLPNYRGSWWAMMEDLGGPLDEVKTWTEVNTLFFMCLEANGGPGCTMMENLGGP